MGEESDAGARAGTGRREEFITGFRDTFPLVLGAVPFGFVFGAAAVTSGLSPAAVQAMSLLVFAGSAQFIGAGLIAQGVAAPFIVLTTFVVNLRHLLYAASLAPYMSRLPQRWLLPLGFWLTDETYAVVIRRYHRHDASPYKHWYYLGSALFMYVNWQLCTATGIVVGRELGQAAGWGLDVAMAITFIGIVVPLLVNRPMLLCAVVAGGVALAADGLPNEMGLMAGALAGIAAGVLAEVSSSRGNHGVEEVSGEGGGA